VLLASGPGYWDGPAVVASGAGGSGAGSAGDDVIDDGWRRDFRRRWAAFAASEVGSALGYSALPIVAVLVLDASAFRVSMLTVLAGVVSALLALPLARGSNTIANCP
jgi:hypothetical protein